VVASATALVKLRGFAETAAGKAAAIRQPANILFIF
jgi:hypothetical protein